PGSPNKAALTKLKAMDLDKTFTPARVRDAAMARACFAGLWLYHDFLDESHTISQDIDTATGSYWHGILHRREPDAAKAAAWCRRVGEYPMFEALAKEAQHLGLRLTAGRWNPFDFIDLCEKYRGTGAPEEMMLRRVQQREWELLFEWSFRAAAGKD